MRVVIAAGGTAGHVNPAISTARAMPENDVTFVGRPQSFEQRLVADAGFAFSELDVQGLDRGNLAAAPATLIRAAGAVVAASRLLARSRPDVVLGMGGFVSLPVSLAAARRRIPLVIHEQNIVLGLANRVSKRAARAVAVSFEETLPAAGPRGTVTGNPISPALERFDRAALRGTALEELMLADDRKTILVFGGSQGASTLNEVAAGLPGFLGRRRDAQVLHVTGARPTVRPATPIEDEVPYRAVEFIVRMDLAYAAADVAVVRGGATTVSELCAAGLPAIVVPYPHHRDRQQERHAEVLARAGAGVWVRDSEATAARIGAIVASWLDDAGELARRAVAARSLARPDAAARLASVVKQAATGGLAEGDE